MSQSSPIEVYYWLCYAMVAVAVVVFLSLFFITAPYGRHGRKGWGPLINSRMGWLVMEAPASLIMLAAFLFVPLEWAIVVLLVIWQIHYFHRAFIYPFTIAAKTMPLSIAGMAIIFNCLNAGLNSWHFMLFADEYAIDWLWSPQFIVGLLVFAAGYFITKRSDALLRSLRGEGDEGYYVPQGFLYRWVSCPNYLGECVQWFGWFLMTLSPAGLVFFIWTVANLLPRAMSHHRWYRQTFNDYPEERRAIIPLVL